MSSTTGTRSQEFKVRPLNGKPREDQQDTPRVLFSSDAIQSLRLSIGKPCFIWKPNGEYGAERRMGIAWNAAVSQNLGKTALQMWPSFKDVCGFKLEDKLSVAPAGELCVAKTVLLTEVESTVAALESHKEMWEVLAKYKLERANTVFEGMSLEFLSGDAPYKRRFVVSSISDDASTASLMKFDTSSSVKIIIKGEDIVTDEPKPRKDLKIAGIAGIDEALSKLNDFLRPFSQPWSPPLLYSKGIAIHGAAGTGKTYLVEKIVRDSQWSVFEVTEETKPNGLSAIFTNAVIAEPSIIVLDDLETMITPELSKSGVFAKSLLKEMRQLSYEKGSKARVVVIATAKTPSSFPQSLYTPGAFGERIVLPVPDSTARNQILQSIIAASDLEIDSAIIKDISERTHAYTGKDLRLLLEKACRIMQSRVYQRTPNEEPIKGDITHDDLERALLAVRPTAMHDVTLQPPKIRWDDIGGQEHTKRALKRAVEIPMKHPELLRRLGTTPKKGILLYGPPGCSKTLSAQAMATEAGFNFFAVKGAELLNMYVGESERAVRDIFARARAASPSIIFFDEIEAIGAKREARNSGVHVLTTLLNEMDGIETLEGVTVLAATNKPESLDLALLRPGRFDDLIYVSPPDLEGREAILKLRQRKMACAEDVDVTRLAQETDGYTGAEIVNICQVAADAVIDRCVALGEFENAVVQMNDLLDAIPKVKKQVTLAMVQKYKAWADGYDI
ncbi:putative ATPase family gene 2 protein [Bisporella sp. PMI_857]|nr:putative ATPase family gene 2 protein [Bisporella sp. PMI_857]